MTREIYLPDSDATYEYGILLGRELGNGAVILLNGDLGAGKTLLAQGIVKGLESEDAVSSPTFALVNIYSGRCKIFHFDLYRLDKSSELDDIGFYELLEAGGVVIIEWADKFAALMPENSIKITIERIPGRSGRRLVIEADNVNFGD